MNKMGHQFILLRVHCSVLLKCPRSPAFCPRTQVYTKKCTTINSIKEYLTSSQVRIKLRPNSFVAKLCDRRRGEDMTVHFLRNLSYKNHQQSLDVCFFNLKSHFKTKLHVKCFIMSDAICTSQTDLPLMWCCS